MTQKNTMTRIPTCHSILQILQSVIKNKLNFHKYFNAAYDTDSDQTHATFLSTSDRLQQ